MVGDSMSWAEILSLMVRLQRSTAPWLCGWPMEPLTSFTPKALHSSRMMRAVNSLPLSDCSLAGAWVSIQILQICRGGGTHTYTS